MCRAEAVIRKFSKVKTEGKKAFKSRNFFSQFDLKD
jgi:hypothetical protein